MKTKKSKKKANKFDKYFKLTWRKAWIIIMSWFVAVLLHNGVSALLGIEEAVFFIIAIFIIPIYVLVVLIYNLIKKFK